jgi:hypothetical protein
MKILQSIKQIEASWQKYNNLLQYLRLSSWYSLIQLFVTKVFGINDNRHSMNLKYINGDFRLLIYVTNRQGAKSESQTLNAKILSPTFACRNTRLICKKWVCECLMYLLIINKHETYSMIPSGDGKSTLCFKIKFITRLRLVVLALGKAIRWNF